MVSAPSQSTHGFWLPTIRAKPPYFFQALLLNFVSLAIPFGIRHDLVSRGFCIFETLPVAEPLPLEEEDYCSERKKHKRKAEERSFLIAKSEDWPHRNSEVEATQNHSYGPKHCHHRMLNALGDTGDVDLAADENCRYENYHWSKYPKGNGMHFGLFS